MRHTLKWSLLVGVSIAGVVLAALKLLQPIRYEHLLFFGYALVGSSVAAGIVVHKNIEKADRSQAAAKTESYPLTRGAGNFSSVVKRISVDSMDAKTEKPAADAAKQNVASVPDFVPASELLAGAAGIENKMSEVGKTQGRESAEEFLEGAEKEEVEKEIRKAENNVENIFQPDAGAGGEILRHCGKRAKIFTKSGEIISGKFAGFDSHAALEDAQCGAERKSFILVSKSEIARMEVE